MILMCSQCIEESAEPVGFEGVGGPDSELALLGAGRHGEDADGTSSGFEDPVQVRSLPGLKP